MFRLIVALFAVALLGACGKDYDPPPPFADVKYPLDAYQAMGQQRVAIDSANAVLLRKCLLRFGVDVPLGAVGKEPSHRADWYGLTNEETARATGYSRVRPQLAEQDQPFMRRIPRTAHPLMTGEAPGTPPGGCQGEAFRAITDGSPAVEDDYLVRKLENDAIDQARGDDSVKAAEKDWRACMKRAGHDAADPMAPFTRWNNKRPAGALVVPPEESAMAIADVKCKQETKLLGFWAAATAVHQQKLIEQNATQLQLHKQRLEHNVQNAESIIAQPRG